MATSNTSSQNIKPEVTRPTANFPKNVWGDRFLSYIHDANEVIDIQKQHIKDLEDEVQKELLATLSQPLEQLILIDTLERLGIAYHYEKEIEEVIKEIYDTYHDFYGEIDLYHTSLLFRLLRQHDFFISSDMFKKYKDENGYFSEAINEDVKGMLGLYEASHLRLHGENILDEALTFTTAQLRLMATTKLSYPLAV
ncbi:hypothetical protein Nepgr_007699 [Nepenthes gracilis]|uniref:Terpene synthase N-terminal domain-containing protein n=1 Tax=Nepenthes gracilis TaxID=150966 RepID=A0AAD3S7R0_NEPGR|nr:hypothetical protein Nepgr_007699 [Nepenthes gracilis]